MHIKSYLLGLWNLWPPFLFTGIKIVHRSADFRHLTVKLKLRFWNSNYLGTQYGGSMFSMTDPFYMVMLIKNLNPQYVIWDKAAAIRYVKPGRTDLTAEFYLTEEDLKDIEQKVEAQGRMDWVRKIYIKDKNGELIAEVDKTVSIKKRSSDTQAATQLKN